MDYSNMYREVYEIINHLEEKLKNKIPKKIIDFIKENKNDNYIFKFDKNKNLQNQNLIRDTLVFLAMLNLNYWCENEKEKRLLINEYFRNDTEREKQIREKYNFDNISKNNNIKNNFNNSVELIEYRENIFVKLWKKIKNFKKGKN